MLRAQIHDWPNDALLTRAETAEFLCVRPELLEEWASQGRGPPYLKIERLVRYRLGDLRLYTDARWRRTINKV